MALLTDFEDIRGILILLVPCLISWYLVSTFISWYRLRHIPGPFVASLTYGWLGYNAIVGRQYEAHKGLHDKYGPLVRVGPNELFTDDPELIRRMNSPKNGYKRGGWYEGGRFNPYHKTMFEETDTSLHDKGKAMVIAGYNGRDLPNMEELVDTQVANLVKLLHRYASPPGEEFRPLSLVNLTSYFALDLISKIALGKEFGCLEADTDLFGFQDFGVEHYPIVAMACEVPLVRKILFSPTFLKLIGPRETDTRGVGKIMGLVNNAVRPYYEPGAKDQKTMLGSFVRHGMTKEKCEVEAILMFVAGSDTSATITRITIFYIISTPRVYQRLKQEIAEAIRDGKVSSPITMAEAKALPYLQAVIYEGLRIRAAGTGLFSKVVPPQGDTVHGKFVPGGTTIGTNLSGLLRSKKTFGKDAEMFRPERFFDLDEEARGKMQRDLELVFGHGRWMCVGKSIAFHELNKIYFEIFRAFDFQMVNPSKPMKSWSSFLSVDEGLWVRVTEAKM